MFIRRYALVFAAMAAALGFGWESTERFEPPDSRSNAASVTIDESAGETALAVIETTRSPILRALSHAKASRAQLPRDVLGACALTAIAVALTWRRHGLSGWCKPERDRLLRSVVHVRAPPLSWVV